MTIDELPKPSEADGGQEVLRVFFTPDKKVVVVISTLALGPDPGVWGVLLADVGHHAAASMHGTVRRDDDADVSQEEILNRIKSFFDAEWTDRTDTVRRVADA